MRFSRNVPAAVLGLMVGLACVTPALAGHSRCTKEAADCAAAMREMFQERGWSGIEEKSRNDDSTITVGRVFPGSPADLAGLKSGDVIVSVNGITLSKLNEERLEAIFTKGFRIGTRLSIGLERGEESRTVRLTLERIPEAVLAARIERHGRERHTIARN